MAYRFFKAHHGSWTKGHFQSLLIGILGLLLLAMFSSSCSDEKSKKPVSAPIPVTVSTAIQKTVPVQLRAIGNVQAYSTVTIKSKVGGELVRVHFTEGQDVKKGAPLFTIDPRPYEAALKQAEANLDRDLAQAKHAREDAQRYESGPSLFSIYRAVPQFTLWCLLAERQDFE
jgi:multidrug efflux system membrane fusion protein